MKVLQKIVVSATEPPGTDCLWIRKVPGGVALYSFDGKWEKLRLMDDHDTPEYDDDTPIDVQGGGGGQLGPDTVGTEQIINNSVLEEDLNSTVRDKIQKTYHQDDESLHMEYDIANQLEEDNN